MVEKRQSETEHETECMLGNVTQESQMKISHKVVETNS